MPKPKKSKKSKKAGLSLIADMQKTSLTKPLVLAGVLHIVIVGVFSVNFIGECIKYQTLHPKEAIAQEKEAVAQKELEDKRKKKAEEAAKKESSEGKTASAENKASGDSSNKVPQVIKDTQEVINEKPEEPTSLNSFDDDL